MSVDEETQRRIEECSAHALANMPPMTAEECAAVGRILDECRIARAQERLRKKREAS